MLSLDQVRKLEARVGKALAYIDQLTEENAALRERLSGYEGRVKDLELLIRDFQQDQGRIEEGILSALERLDAFEESGHSRLAAASDGVAAQSTEPPPEKPRAATVKAPSPRPEPIAEAPAISKPPTKPVPSLGLDDEDPQSFLEIDEVEGKDEEEASDEKDELDIF